MKRFGFVLVCAVLGSLGAKTAVAEEEKALDQGFGPDYHYRYVIGEWIIRF